jgi:guanylate kinase
MSKKILGTLSKGLLFLLSAPAGTGKSTLVNRLLKEFPEEIEESCSCTTRLPRPREIKEKDYDFLSIEEFEKKISRGEFLEYARVFGNYYGTLKSEVSRIQESGKHAILIIDTQGVLQLKERVEATSIFIKPPSMEELKKRLFKRRTEDDETIAERLRWAEKELIVGEGYDYQFTNDDLDVSYQILRSIIISEEYKRR